MAICWERAVHFAFHLCYFNFSVVLVVRVPFRFGVWDRMWNMIESVPDHCLFIYFVKKQFATKSFWHYILKTIQEVLMKLHNY